MTPGQRTAVAPADLYLGLMKRVLTRYGLEQGYEPLPAWPFWNRVPKGRQLAQLIDRSPLQLARRVEWNAKTRSIGRDRPVGAETMCRKAAEDFRREQGISDPIEKVDWTGVFWQRSE